MSNQIPDRAQVSRVIHSAAWTGPPSHGERHPVHHEAAGRAPPVV